MRYYCLLTWAFADFAEYVRHEHLGIVVAEGTGEFKKRWHHLDLLVAVLRAEIVGDCTAAGVDPVRAVWNLYFLPSEHDVAYVSPELRVEHVLVESQKLNCGGVADEAWYAEFERTAVAIVLGYS